MITPWRLLLGFLLGGSYSLAGLGAEATPAEIERRVDGLLARMTVEEKVGQLAQVSGDRPAGAGRDAVIAAIRQGKVGSIFDLHGAKVVNEMQQVALTASRLKIPILFGYDVIHGYRTITPVPLAVAGSWDPRVGEEAARIGASEARAAGVAWTFAPMVDVSREPRWGRMVEGAGEDPFLGAAMARAQVRGFQGTDLNDLASVAACVKHWVAYGAVTGGREYNAVDLSEHTLRTTYFPPFLAAKEAGVAAFMSSLNSVNGVPATANPFTLTTVLRGEWGFEGLVVADFKAVEQLIPHGLAGDAAEAGRLAFTAGVDMEEKSFVYTDHLPALVRQGLVPTDRLDGAVRRVLRLKHRLGLFEHPLTDEAAEAGSLMTAENRTKARSLAGRSLVLLRNERELLPIKASVHSIAVIGPFAEDGLNLLGPWHGAGRGEDAPTILQAVRSAARDRDEGITVEHSQGCKPTGDEENILQAVATAQRADLVVLAVGEPWTMSGEATSRSHLGLPGRQLELVKAVVAAGKPVAVVLLNGRPITVDWEALGVAAVLEAWFPGVQGGPAIADALFGITNPGGKLPVTFPRSVGEVPWYYNHLNTGRPGATDDKYTSKYIDEPLTPLYPFGFGLSYARFTLGPPRLSRPTIAPDGSLDVTAEIKNVGTCAGDEVVQLYLRDVAASVVRPVQELCGFERVTLQPGESRTIGFRIGPKELGLYDRTMKFVVEPGEFLVQVGTSSAAVQTSSFRVVGANSSPR